MDFKKFKKGKTYDEIEASHHDVSGALCVVWPN